jgi:hypothetical protein
MSKAVTVPSAVATPPLPARTAGRFRPPNQRSKASWPVTTLPPVPTVSVAMELVTASEVPGTDITQVNWAPLSLPDTMKL